MKIIFLNNYYYIRGGSERVFFGEMDMMKEHGHTVAGFARKSPSDLPAEFARFFPPNIVTDKISLSWEAVRTMKEIFYSHSARNGLAQLLSSFKPDIAHVHNMYGRLTTSVLDLLAAKKIPVVMTLHDCKLVCPTYLFMNKGKVCEDCRGGKYYMAVRNRCHKGSYAASAIVALESFFTDVSGKYRNNVRFFIPPSHFLRNKLMEYGWPGEQLRRVPNFLNLADFEPNFNPGNYFLYLGRLSEEKGVTTLIRSFRELKKSEARLVIVGEGPLCTKLQEMAGNDNRISFTGYLSGKALQDITRNALAIVIPSECYENAPMSVLEAFAYGKPVIGSAIGGIPEMVVEGDNGFLFRTGDINDLTAKLDYILNLPDTQITKMGQSGRAKAEREYTPETHYQQLMNVYQDALKGS